MAALHIDHSSQPTIWIETDMEPDDMWAILLIGHRSSYIVVGEGDANIKYNRMMRYVDLLHSIKQFDTKPMIIEGMSSRKKYLADGFEFNNLSTYLCPEWHFDNFEEFANKPNPIMFSLKPMREILNWYLQDTEKIAQLLSKITLYVYGSFNFRCLFEHKNTLLDIIKLFKSVYIYESFYATPSCNSFDESNKLLYNWTMAHKDNPFISALLLLTKQWNSNIIIEKRAELQLALSTDKIVRIENIINNVMGHEDFQFVIADFALIVMYLANIPAVPVTNLRFDKFTEFDLCNGLSTSHPSTSIYVYKDILPSQIEQLMVEYLQLVID